MTKSKAKNTFESKQFKLIAIASMLIISIIISLSIGFLDIPFLNVIKVFFGGGSYTESFTIINVRLPRIVIVLLVGFALSLSGAILQTVSKNDLADPGILGINAGAGLGVTIAYMMLPLSGSTLYILPLCSFAGAILMFGVVMFFSIEKDKGINPDKLVVTGIGTAIALSGLMILLINSMERTDVQFIKNWLSGDIWGDKWEFVFAVFPWVLFGTIYVYKKRWTLDIMNLDEISTKSVGVSVERERLILIIVAVLLASVSVSVAGAISFVGLIVPHVAKLLFGPLHKNYLPGCMLLGGLLMVISDFIGRNVFYPQGMPAGIVVSLIGAPYFLYLVYKKGK